MRRCSVGPFRAYFERLGDGGNDNGCIIFPGESVMPLVGDVNGDGSVDIEDVNALLNVILDVTPADFYAGVTDLNSDHTVDVEDVNILINIILSE